MQIKYSLNVPAAAARPAYEFTADWFAVNVSTWDKLLPRINPRRLLEIGSFEGNSACYMIERCASQHPIELHCIDTWEGGVEHRLDNFVAGNMGEVERRFDKNTELAKASARHPVVVVKHKNLSSVALVELLAVPGNAGSFDLIYVDGSHQAADVLLDAVLSFQLLRLGGLLIFDDYLWSMEPVGTQDPLNMPKPAIDAFLNLYQRKIRVVSDAPLRQIYANKTAG
ncbi:MAG: class I SAM-dependent methyltransferase [Betaproteobacteria bacterium]